MRNRRRQDGVVLVISMMAMTCVILFGVAYLEVASYEAEAPNTALARAQTRSLAEGGLEVGYRRLLDDPTFRGTIGPVTVGGGSFTVEITETAGIVELQSYGNTDTVSSGIESAVQLVTGTATGNLEETFIVGGQIVAFKSDASWSGSAKAAGGPDYFKSSVSGDVELAPDFSPIAIDVAAMLGAADQTFVGATTLGPGPVSGSIFVSGDVSISTSCDFTGTLMVDGDVTISGEPVTLTASDGGAVIIATGRVYFDMTSQTTVNGSIFALGEVKLFQSTVTGTGSIVANDRLYFGQSTANWSFDAGNASVPPSAVTSAMWDDDGGGSDDLQFGGSNQVDSVTDGASSDQTQPGQTLTIEFYRRPISD